MLVEISRSDPREEGEMTGWKGKAERKNVSCMGKGTVGRKTPLGS